MNELKSNDYSVDGEFTVDDLFEVYVNSEICSLKDLKKDHHGFVDFVKAHVGYFKCANDREKRVVSGLAYMNASHLMLFSNKFFKTNLEEQEVFVKAVEEVVDHDKKCKILEVGSGYIPYSSILLGDDGMDITSVDQFKISEQNLSLLNVKSYKQFFDKTIDVAKYDIVVGRKPCTAIKAIVENCKKRGVSYFLNLCTCDAPHQTISGWRDLLSVIDEDIHFVGDYAYNLKNMGKKECLVDEIVKDSDEKYAKWFYLEKDGELI